MADFSSMVASTDPQDQSSVATTQPAKKPLPYGMPDVGAETKKLSDLEDKRYKENLDSVERSGKLLQDKITSYKDAMSKIKSPPDPNIQDVPEAPSPQMRDPTQVLGSLGSLLAIFGSMKTRAPMTSALNSMAAAMKGFHQGDQERVKLETEKWQNNFKKALQQNQIEMQKYVNALEKNKFNMQAAQADFNLFAVEDKWNEMKSAIDNQHFDKQWALIKLNIDSGEKGAQTLANIDLRKQQEADRQERMRDAAQAHADAQKIVVMGANGPELLDKSKLPEMQPGEKNITKFGASSPSAGASDMSDPAAAKFWADKYLDDKSIPAFSWGGASGNKDRQLWREAIVREAAARGMSGGDAAANQAIYKANQSSLAATTKDLNMLEPYKKMLDINGDVAIKLGKDIVRTDSALANKSINWLKKNAGDYPDTAEYLFQINTVQTEAARVLNNPRLVGQLSDQARQDMQEVLSGAMPIEASERVIRRMQKDGSYRVDQLKAQVEDIKGQLNSGAPQSAAPQGGLPAGWSVTVH